MPHLLSLLLLCWSVTLLSAQSDSLLQSAAWEEEGTGYVLTFTPDGTFEQDFGPGLGRGRYLLGRYAREGDRLTLSVDYFLGRRRLSPRYRRGQDFYLPYRIDSLRRDRLVLTDSLTHEVRRFRAGTQVPTDPANRRLTPTNLPELRLPDKGGSRINERWNILFFLTDDQVYDAVGHANPGRPHPQAGECARTRRAAWGQYLFDGGIWMGGLGSGAAIEVPALKAYTLRSLNRC